MPLLELHHVSKTFGITKAVSDVTFAAEEGQITSVIGPNGAGKTTTIRMILDLIRPDDGEIHIFGEPLNPVAKNRLGYLPEERGLYRNATLDECVMFFAKLKGLSSKVARERAMEWYERFGLTPHRKKVVAHLSRGMQQKGQFIVALIHQPKLLIVDEPFAALDPVSTRLIKRTLREAAAQGACVVLCTHQMHLVEELADALVMINHGRVALQGRPAGIRRRYASGAVLVRGKGTLERETPIYTVEDELANDTIRLKLAPGMELPALLEVLAQQSSFELEHLEVEHPTLEDIFVRVAGEEALSHPVAA